MPWDTVKRFEEQMADYAGAKYGVAVDSCTSAIFLCFKRVRPSSIVVPQQTYISVPMSALHAGIAISFEHNPWFGGYLIGDIYDGARQMKRNMFMGGLHCLSFHAKKHIPIGRGGMILTDSKTDAEWFRRARYDGRHPEIPFMQDDVDMLGWNCYMTPEQAARGLQLLSGLSDELPDGSYMEYPDLSKMSVFN